MKILILQTAFIGDVVLALPIAQAIKKTFPQAEIHFLVRKGNESLTQNHWAIQHTWIWDKKQKLNDLVRLIRELRFHSFELAINVQRFFSSGLIISLIKAKEKRGFSKNPLSIFWDKRLPHIIDGRHEVERNLSLVSDLTNIAFERPQLYPSQDDENFVSVWKQEPYFVIAPASVWFTKQFPENRWIELIRLLPELPIFLVGAPNDFDLCSRLASIRTDVTNLAGKLSFLQTAALMRDAVQVFVNDSAPLHFASAVNAPVTAIFCSTVPEFGFGPLSDTKRIVEIRPSCKPCGLHGHQTCPQGHFDCGQKIPIQSLLNW
ncbi:MAG: glycosyltransferase family 9 protein [Bacteroidia bacterium]|nr:glycosyltransferase family 9 protein [Bacteroidia bacterium]